MMNGMHFHPCGFFFLVADAAGCGGSSLARPAGLGMAPPSCPAAISAVPVSMMRIEKWRQRVFPNASQHLPSGFITLLFWLRGNGATGG